MKKYGWDDSAFAADREGDVSNPTLSFSVDATDDAVIQGVSPPPEAQSWQGSVAPSRPPSRTNDRSPLGMMTDWTATAWRRRRLLTYLQVRPTTLRKRMKIWLELCENPPPSRASLSKKVESQIRTLRDRISVQRTATTMRRTAGPWCPQGPAPSPHGHLIPPRLRERGLLRRRLS